MQTFVIALFLGIVLGLFGAPVQAALRAWFQRGRARVFLIPAGLFALFAGVLAARGALSGPFLLLVAAYVTGPTLLVYANGPGEGGRPWLDFAAILALWLPVEFTTGKELLPQPAWSIANITARGTAIALGLFLFLIYRGLKGMKYNLPSRLSDLFYPAIGFAVVAPVLVVLGIKLRFMGRFEMPEHLSAAAFGVLFLKTLLGVALPEEILFRALIQNWLMQNFGFTNRVLLVAALIFGAAHLDNPPAPLPNWRYMLLATIAGFVYGKVFQKSTTVLSSAGLHAFGNSVRHMFFL